MAQNYKLLVEGIENRINPEHVALDRSFLDELSTIKYSDVLVYVRLAMKGVEPEYTRRNMEAGERAKGHLSSVLSNVTYRYQGSVMTNTHIRAHSDIDLLVISNKFYTYDYQSINQAVTNQLLRANYYPTQLQKLQEEINVTNYQGSPEDDLRQLRVASENKLSSVYSTCDTINAKAIKIRNMGLGRDVDVVIANYYDDVKSVINDKQKDYRGIQVYNKLLHQRGKVDFPFLSIERVNTRGNATNGRLKKMIRFLKNMKARSTHDITLSSFDFNAICYEIDPSTYQNLIFYQLVPVLYRQVKSICENKFHSDRLMSVDERESIFIGKPDKLQELQFILSELESVYKDLIAIGKA